MENYLSATEAPRRYDREDLALFVEKALAVQPVDRQLEWATLAGAIRAHVYPFFYVAPSTRIIDLVTHWAEVKRAA